jgi:hypothetical protein
MEVKKLRKKLEEKIYEQGYPDAQFAPIVTLEDFFEGNNDESSIGCNLMEHPGIEKFYDVLLNIRNKANVQDVLVEISEFEEDENYWAFSERIYVLTSIDKSLLGSLVQDLEPTEIDEGYAFGDPPNAPNLLSGYKIYSIWWD